MPRLGEAVEPSHVERVEPWWRAVAALEKGRGALDEPAGEETGDALVAGEPID